MARKNSFYAGKKEPGKGLKPVVFILVLAALAVGSFFAVKMIREHSANAKETHSKYYCESAFSAEGMDGYSSIKYLADGLLVFTNENNAKGLMNYEGDPLTKPLYSDFSVVRNGGWHNVVYTATPLGEPYPKTVIVAEQRVDIKQYQGAEKDTSSARWDEKSGALTWFGENPAPISFGELMLGEGLYAVPNSTLGAYGYVNQSLELVIPTQYAQALDFADGMGAVKQEGKWGFINESGEAATPFCFDSVGDFTVEGVDYCFGFAQGLAPVLKNGKMGIIDKEGKMVVDYDYTVIFPGENGKFVARKDGKWGVLALAGVPENVAVSHTNPEGVGTAGKGVYRVSTGGSPLNMRAEGDSAAEILVKIPNGSRINVAQIKDGWAFAAFNNTTGWVSADYLEEVEETTVSE